MISSPNLANIVKIFNLTEEQALCVADFIEPVTFRRGEFVFREGELSRGMYFIQEGEIILQHDNVVIKKLFKSDCFAEASLLLNHHCLNSAVAVVETQVELLNHANLLKLRAHYPTIAILMITHLQTRLSLASLSAMRNLLLIEKNRHRNPAKYT
jgi:CRP-like cAMP-binding protein